MTPSDAPPDPRPAPPPAGPAGEPPAADPAAEAAVLMARMQQRLDRIGEATRRADAAPRPAPASPAQGREREPWIVALAALVGIVLVVGTYLASAVPGAWFPGDSPRTFRAEEMQLTRGSGTRADGAIFVEAPGEGGVAIVSLPTDLASQRIRGLEWKVAGLPAGAQVRVLWFADTDPGRINSLPAVVEAGRVRPAIVAGATGWNGRIRGLGLSVAGALPRPFSVWAVTAKPMGAFEILSDRLGEWRAFEGWNGTSINVVVGGAEVQDFPLPALLAAIVGVTALLLLAVHRLRPALLPHAGTGIAIVLLAAWLVVDLRWTANLGRQVATTFDTFAGKPDRDRRLADVDGVLYEFIERARAVLPPTPQRIWIASDAPFFNGRAAYHLYPNDVHFAPRDRAMPDVRWLKAGDWLLVFNRRGVEYNPRNETLRWDGGAEVPAVLKLPGNSAALFQLK